MPLDPQYAPRPDQVRVLKSFGLPPTYSNVNRGALREVLARFHTNDEKRAVAKQFWKAGLLTRVVAAQCGVEWS
jgi:hypothetical protein